MAGEERAARAQRELEVDALIDRLIDPADEYDAHHGADRTEKGGAS